MTPSHLHTPAVKSIPRSLGDFLIAKSNLSLCLLSIPETPIPWISCFSPATLAFCVWCPLLSLLPLYFLSPWNPIAPYILKSSHIPPLLASYSCHNFNHHLHTGDSTLVLLAVISPSRTPVHHCQPFFPSSLVYRICSHSDSHLPSLSPLLCPHCSGLWLGPHVLDCFRSSLTGFFGFQISLLEILQFQPSSKIFFQKLKMLLNCATSVTSRQPFSYHLLCKA